MTAHTLNFKEGLIRIWITMSVIWMVGALVNRFPDVEYLYKYHFEFESLASESIAVNGAVIELITEDINKLYEKLVEREKNYNRLTSILNGGLNTEVKPDRKEIEEIKKEIANKENKINELNIKKIDPIKPDYRFFLYVFLPPTLVYFLAIILIFTFRYISNGFTGNKSSENYFVNDIPIINHEINIGKDASDYSRHKKSILFWASCAVAFIFWKIVFSTDFSKDTLRNILSNNHGYSDLKVNKIEDIARQIAENSNKNKQAMLDENTVSFNAASIDKNVIFKYVIRVKSGLPKETIEKWLEETKNEITLNACENNKKNPAFDLGLTYTFSYSNTNGENLGNVFVDKETCRKQRL